MVDQIYLMMEQFLGRKITDEEKQNISVNGEVKTNRTIRRHNCKHRSIEDIRKEGCSTCSGNIQIKVFGCKLHKECCFSDKLESIKNCNTCDDFEVKE